MRFIINLGYVFAGLLFSPIVIYRRVRHGRYRRGWSQRFGRINRQWPEKKCIWLHAVSVGEVNAAKTLLAEIEHRFDDFEIIISTTTDTGFAQAKALFGQSKTVFYFPFDFSPVMRRAFVRLRPSVCLLMELEVWPNFMHVAHKNRVPVVVVNGRISDRSFSRYRRVKWLTRMFFRKINLALAQTEEYAERFRTLGCRSDHVIVTSSLKYDTAQVADSIDGDRALAKQLNLGNARLLVAGGTGNDEEQIVLTAYQSLVQDKRFRDIRLAVVPRKPERFDEVAQLIEQMGFGLIRYSQFKDTSDRASGSQDAVILGDTMGDLRKFYSLAELIFVGRSLVPMGGSDMMEAAALGKCTIFGPHAFNFKQTVAVLLAGNGALVVEDGDALLATLKKCFSDSAYAQGVARRGQQVIRDNQGATTRTVEHIAHILHRM